MVRRKYTAKLAAAVTSSSASIAIIIPPSIAMIIYGALADASIVQLFVAGVVPGVLGLYLTEIQVPQKFARWVMDLTNNKYAVLALLNCGLFVIGMFLHGAAAIILVVPIVMPLINQIGIDPIQFGLIMTLNIAVGQQTPPVASVLVTSCSIAKTDIWETTKVNIPFILVLLGVLLLVTYVPAVSLTLVDIFFK